MELIFLNLQNFSAEAHIDVKIVHKPIDKSRVHTSRQGISSSFRSIGRIRHYLNIAIHKFGIVTQGPSKFCRINAQK